MFHLKSPGGSPTFGRTSARSPSSVFLNQLGGGYLHIHAVIIFKEKEFFALKRKGKNGKETWRIPYHQKQKFASWWHSFVDVEACVSWKHVLVYIKKYLLKLHGAKNVGKTAWDLTEEVADLTLALMWVYRKRGFGIS